MKKSSSSRRQQRRKKPRTTKKLRERLSIVRRLRKEGKLQRQIARKLGCDEGTVRHDIRILQLPDEWVKRIENGEPAEPFLRKARTAAARKEQQQRLQAETETGQYSDEVAKEVLAWLMTKLLTRADENMIMEIVEQRMRRAGNLAVAPRRDAAKTLAFCGRGKPPSYMPEQIEFYANAILQALLLLAPEKLVRDNAIAKAAAAVNKPGRRTVPPRPRQREYNIPRRPY
jgi:transposase